MLLLQQQERSGFRFHHISLIISNRHCKLLTKHRHHGVERHHLPSFCAPLRPAVCAVEADVEKLDAGSKIVAFPTIKIESPTCASVCEGSVRSRLTWVHAHARIISSSACWRADLFTSTSARNTCPPPSARAHTHTCLAADGGIKRVHGTARITCHERFVERSVVLDTE